MERVRVDRWLSAARVFKSRTRAHDACAAGKVKVNGESARPNQLVALDDEIRVQAPGGLQVLRILALAEKRLPPPLARALYEDQTPPAARVESDLIMAVRERGAGRPTKRERRILQRLRRGE